MLLMIASEMEQAVWATILENGEVNNYIDQCTSSATDYNQAPIDCFTAVVLGQWLYIILTKATHGIIIISSTPSVTGPTWLASSVAMPILASDECITITKFKSGFLLAHFVCRRHGFPPRYARQSFPTLWWFSFEDFGITLTCAVDFQLADCKVFATRHDDDVSGRLQAGGTRHCHRCSTCSDDWASTAWHDLTHIRTDRRRHLVRQPDEKPVHTLTCGY